MGAGEPHRRLDNGGQQHCPTFGKSVRPTLGKSVRVAVCQWGRDGAPSDLCRSLIFMRTVFGRAMYVRCAGKKSPPAARLSYERKTRDARRFFASFRITVLGR